MTSPITPSLFILIPLSLRTQPPEDFGGCRRDPSLHNISTDTSDHLKSLGSGLLSPDRDGYHRSGKSMKERCGLPLAGKNLFRIAEPHYL